MSRKAWLAAAAGWLLAGSAQAQIDLRLGPATGSGEPVAGSELLLSASVPPRSESGLAAEMPAIWIDPYAGKSAALSDSACQARIEGFSRNLAFNAPALDLLAYQLATVAADGTITVLDPRGGFGASRMLDRLELDAKPGALLHDAARRRLWLSLPERSSLALIDTAGWDLVREIPLPAPLRQLGAAADGVWASVAPQGAQGAELLFFGGAGAEPQARLPLPGEPAEVLLAPGGRVFAVVAGQLFVHDGPGWRGLGRPAARLLFSAAAEAVVALAPGGGLALFESSGELRAELPAAQAADDHLALSPDGRWAFAWAAGRPDLRVADLSRQAWRGELRVDAPTELAFSEQYLYTRSATRGEILVTPLESLDAPGLVAGKLVAGGTGPHPRPLAASMAGLPGGEGMFWASAADRQIYAYHQGMNAASGSLKHPGAEPRDLLLAGPLLRETAPGSFAARLVLPRPGRYLVAAASRQPAAISCRIVEVAGEPGARLAEARLDHLSLPERWPAGRPFHLRFDASLPGGELPAEIAVLLMNPAGTWQSRFRARRPAGAADRARFEAELAAPAPGPHFVILRWQPPDQPAKVRRLAIEILPEAGDEEAP